MADETTNNENKSTVTLPRNALIKEVPERNYALFNMPKSSELAGYRFLLDLDKVVINDDGTVSVTLDGCIKARRDGDEKRVSADEAAAVLSSAKEDDFTEDTFSVTIPSSAVYGRYVKAYRLLMPYDSEYKGCFCSVLSSAVEEDKEAGTVTLNLSDWMYVNVAMRDGEKVRVPAKEFADIMENGKDSYTDRTHWVTVTVSKDAVLDKHQKQTRLRMPEGEYKGYAYYIPNGMLKDKKDGNMIIMLPETRNVYIKNVDGDKIILTSKEFKEKVDGKGAEAYTAVRKADAEQFIRKAREIKEKLPKELVETPNWVDVRIWKDKKGQREYVSSSMQRNLAIGRDEPARQGASYEDVEAYGQKHRTDTVGFLFDGLGVVCLSVNGCLNDEGNFTSPAAQKIFGAAKGTYVEKSSDGKDMHVFGRMAGLKTEHISKDGGMELYAASDFIPVTGDAMTDAKELKGFTEGSVMRGIIESNFEDIKPIEPLTAKDEKILEAAKKHPETGDVFTRLFAGENVKGTEEQSDESLMMRLSCRTRGDTDAMKRLYNASGRKNKDPEHIDHLAVRSKKNTADFLSEEKAREIRERAEARRTDYSNSNYNSGYKY